MEGLVDGDDCSYWFLSDDVGVDAGAGAAVVIRNLPVV